MKSSLRIIGMVTLLAGFTWTTAPGSEAAGRTNAVPAPVGIYDSRAIAYAWFWSDDHQRQLNERVQAAKVARAAGDLALAGKLEKALANEQEEIHRQVFGVAPATEALVALEGRLPELKKQAGVSALISRWDTQTLAQHKAAEQKDLTDVLIREFKPSEKHRKVIAEIRTRPPALSNPDAR